MIAILFFSFISFIYSRLHQSPCDLFRAVVSMLRVVAPHICFIVLHIGSIFLHISHIFLGICLGFFQFVRENKNSHVQYTTSCFNPACKTPLILFCKLNKTTLHFTQTSSINHVQTEKQRSFEGPYLQQAEGQQFFIRMNVHDLPIHWLIATIQ